MKQTIGWLLALGFMLAGVTAGMAEAPRVIAYGNDLTLAERTQLANDFPIPAGVKPEEIKVVTVTNEEEWSLLRGLVPDAQIGAKALSSVYIEKLESGAGVKVDTKNITFITPRIYANALVTAGVTDAKVFATAPVGVSGTAALVGIFKSFTELTGKTLTATVQRTAAEELIATGNLGEKVGKERAAVLVERAKERVVEKPTVTKEEVTKIIEQSAKEQDIKLSQTEKEELAQLMLKVKQLNIDLGTLQKQLKNYTESSTPPSQTEKPKSFLARIIEFFQNLFSQLTSFVGRILRH